MTKVEQLLGETIETISPLITFRQVLTTARSFRLTAYDAVYLEVSRSEGVLYAVWLSERELSFFPNST